MAKRSRKRRSAWASITELDAGERYRIRYWAETESGYRRKSETVRGTRMDAERRRAELMLEHSEDAPCPTVGQAWERWALPAYERRCEDGELSPQTLAQMRSGWRNKVAPRWGDVPCDAVQPLAVQQWLDGLPRGRAESALKMLRPTLDHAVRYGFVATNPFRERYLLPSRSTVSRRDRGVWTLAELGDVWRRCAWGQWWEAAFLAMAFGGLRVGEAMGLRAEDVSKMSMDGMSACAVRVERQVMNHRAEVSYHLKNRHSHRTAAVPGRAGARLLSIAAENDGWLSGDGLGNPSNHMRLTRAWDSALEGEDGIERHPMRNLRNSFETNTRWELGMPPWLLEPLIGHAGQGVTGQYYDRPSTEMLVRAMASAHASKPYDAGWTWAG